MQPVLGVRLGVREQSFVTVRSVRWWNPGAPSSLGQPWLGTAQLLTLSELLSLGESQVLQSWLLHLSWIDCVFFQIPVLSPQGL